MTNDPATPRDVEKIVTKLVAFLLAPFGAIWIDAFTGHLSENFTPQFNTVELFGFALIWTPGALFMIAVVLFLLRKRLIKLVLQGIIHESDRGVKDVE